MRLTKRGEYRLRVLIRLGVAHRMAREVVSVSELARSERLPFKFLEQILADFRGEGYVESVRGKFGGAKLARDPKTIKVGEIVRLIDGRLAPIGCASETDYERCTCPDETHCGLRMLMIDVRNAIANILDRYTLEDVVEVTLRKILRDGGEAAYGIEIREPETARPATASARRAARNPAPGRANPADGFLALLSEDISTSHRKAKP